MKYIVTMLLVLSSVVAFARPMNPQHRHQKAKIVEQHKCKCCGEKHKAVNGSFRHTRFNNRKMKQYDKGPKFNRFEGKRRFQRRPVQFNNRHGRFNNRPMMNGLRFQRFRRNFDR